MKTLSSEGRSRKILLTLLIVALSAFVVYQSYLVFFDSSGSAATADAGALRDSVQRRNHQSAVQVDVLNGSGASGVAQKMTAYARSLGYDVVEMRNYKTPDVRETLIIDRCGNMEMARRIASDLGIQQKNVLQQLNPDYFVAASIVVGKDYKILPAWLRTKK